MLESTPAVSSSHAGQSTSPSRPAPAAGRPMGAPIFGVDASPSGTTLVYNTLLASGDLPGYGAGTMLLDERRSRYGRLSNRYLEVRYEDLVADTEGVLAVINGFADVSIGIQSLSDLATGSLKRANGAFAQTTGGISTSAVRRWRKKLAAREAACLHVAIGRTLEELGCAVPDGSPVSVSP